MTPTDLTTDPEVQALVGPQLHSLAGLLADQPPSVADAPSLCDGWAVKHVVAHMTMAARYDPPAFMAELAAAGHDFETLSEQVARRDGDRPFASLLDDLRSDTMAAWAPPGGGPTGALTHAVIHGLDITGALDLRRTADDQATRLVLDTLTGEWPATSVSTSAVVRSRRPTSTGRSAPVRRCSLRRATSSSRSPAAPDPRCPDAVSR